MRGAFAGFVISLGLLTPAVALGQNGGADSDAFVLAPMPDLFQQVEGKFPGRILTVELAREPAAGTWSYEVKLLTELGDVLNLSYDARSLALLRTEGRGYNGDGRTGSQTRSDYGERENERENERDDSGSEKGDSSDD